MSEVELLKNIKNYQLDFENQYLSPFAAKSSNSKGRRREEEACPIRTEFQRDRDRILHSKAFRRLKHKTQVFISPNNDHYRTRMTHTLEVSQIARTIARALRLNEDLTEAIALGHDLGHTPFGHTGEDVLNGLLSSGFRHNEQSVRMVTFIEDLNLTVETIEGIQNHRTECPNAETLEGQVVRIADKIAYLCHDIDDAIRAEIINEANKLPQEYDCYFGTKRSSKITAMVTDVVVNSLNSSEINMSVECTEMMKSLRSWMSKNIYTGSPAKKEESKAKKIIIDLFNYYVELLKNHKNLCTDDENLIQITVTDSIAGMTDNYAIKLYQDKFMPSLLNYNADDGFLIKLAEKNNILRQ